MELLEAMRTLRAVRKLKRDPVPEDVLRRVLEAATWAPTGGNHQGWRIIVVRDTATKARLQALYKPHWDAYAPKYEQHMASMPPTERDKSARALVAATHLAEHLHEAPLIAVFCFNPERMTITDASLGRPSVVGGGSVYPAVQNLLLACRNEGLGCVLTTLLCLEEAHVKPLLGIPDGWYTCAFVPIGYPLGKGHGSISRRPVGEMVFADRFGQHLS
jgi:nitroreductase